MSTAAYLNRMVSCRRFACGGSVEFMSAETRTPHVNDSEVIRRLLTTPARWAVVGLSNNPRRVAPGVSKFLQEKLGMKIVPVSLRGDSVLGEPGFQKLADIPGHIDVVNCFVNSSRVGEVVDQAIAIGADAVWLQLGVIDEEAAERAEKAGLKVVMNTCPVIEFPHL